MEGMRSARMGRRKEVKAGSRRGNEKNVVKALR
jgi:hypothetical protein